MFSFSIWRSHQPFGKASPIWVECILWDEGKEGGSGVRGQGGDEGELWDGELGGALLRCQVKQRASSFSEQGELLWDLFFIFLYFCCLDPATSTAVERLFSAAGLIMHSKRNKLSPAFVDKLLFLCEAHLLGICKLDWKWKVTSCRLWIVFVNEINVPLTVPIRCYHCLKKGPYFRDWDLGPYFIISLVPISQVWISF